MVLHGVQEDISVERRFLSIVVVMTEGLKIHLRLSDLINFEGPEEPILSQERKKKNRPPGPRDKFCKVTV